jgi:uncharacterized protein (TIGR02677 family)
MARSPADNPAVPSEAVPQANSLDKLRRLVEAVATAGLSAPTLQKEVDLSPRHLRYYLLAARTLGWVDLAAEGPGAVTGRGRRLLTTDPGDPAEAVQVAEAIRQSELLLCTVGAYLDEPQIGVDELAARIARQTGLSPATARRRAACLTGWRSQLRARGWRPSSLPYEAVSPELEPEPQPIEAVAATTDPRPARASSAPDSARTEVEPTPPLPPMRSSEQPRRSGSHSPQTPGQRLRLDLSEGSVTEHAFMQQPRFDEPAGLESDQLSEATPPPLILQPLPAFKYVTEENAPTYRAIVQAFFAAKQHYVIELRPADVEREIAAHGFHAPLAGDRALDYHLDKLVEWGNLSASHDTAAVTTIEDFYKKSYVYHLTAVGEAAHRAVLEVEATVGRSGSLQANMLLEIRDGLRRLAEIAASTTIDPERALRTLHALFAAFDTLTEEAAHFIGDVTQGFAAERIEEEQFVLRKHALVAYISRFLDHLRKLSGEIAGGVVAVEARGVDRLLQAAATSADLPPALNARDPAVEWLEARRQRWSGMRGWFCATAGAEPTVERLTGVAVEAIVGLTRALGRLNAQRIQPLDRQADFITLARWFGRTRTDRDAHRLYEAAFGLQGARHFHIAEEDPGLAQPGQSWWQTAPVAVFPTLRTRGTVTRAGRPAAAPDHTASRAWLAQRQRRERQQLEQAQRRFAGRGALRLSDVAEVSSAELDLLLALLDEALASPRRPDGSRSTRTADGRLTVTLRPSTDSGAWVELQTPRGRIRCHDYRIEVAGCDTAAREAAS